MGCNHSSRASYYHLFFYTSPFCHWSFEEESFIVKLITLCVLFFKKMALCHKNNLIFTNINSPNRLIEPERLSQFYVYRCCQRISDCNFCISSSQYPALSWTHTKKCVYINDFINRCILYAAFCIS